MIWSLSTTRAAAKVVAHSERCPLLPITHSSLDLQAGATDGAASQPALYVDCANGVGAAAAVDCLRGLGLEERLFNTGDGGLNDGCGADFVQKEQRVPEGCPAAPADARHMPNPKP